MKSKKFLILQVNELFYSKNIKGMGVTGESGKAAFGGCKTGGMMGKSGKATFGGGKTGGMLGK